MKLAFVLKDCKRKTKAMGFDVRGQIGWIDLTSSVHTRFEAIFLILTHAIEPLSHKSIDLYSFAQMV